MMNIVRLTIQLPMVALLAPLSALCEVKIISGPVVQYTTENSATIVWATNVDAVSWVEAMPDDGSHFYAEERKKYFDSPLGKKQIGKVHRIKLDGLKKSSTYNYRAFSKEVVDVKGVKVFYGDVASTRVYKAIPPSFKTFDDSLEELAFSVVNDIHEKSDLLKALLKHVPKEADFLIFNGDMVNSMSSPSQIYDGFFSAAAAATNSSKPIFFARGNHEARGPISDKYSDYFPTPTGKPYYSTKIGETFFIFLDSGEDKPDSDIEYYGLADFDKYRIEQGEWLKCVVESDAFKAARHRIVVTHIPPAWGEWHGSRHFRKVFAPILNGRNIDVYLSGHLHSHKFYPAGEVFDAPTVANSNSEIMNVKIRKDGITLSFCDAGGKKKRPDIVIKK